MVFVCIRLFKGAPSMNFAGVVPRKRYEGHDARRSDHLFFDVALQEA
jgi:hypothetical protein